MRGPFDTSGGAIGEEFHLLHSSLSRIARSDAAFNREQYSEHTLRNAAAQWRGRMRVEHRSSMVFLQLAHQLFESGAPYDAVAVMTRMALDELRHTDTCRRVLEALEGAPLVMPSHEQTSKVQPLAQHEGISLRERALRNVIYTTCLSELVACARFVAVIDRTVDPFMRAALRALLADEVLHGQFGFHYLSLEAEWLSENPAVRASVERYLVHAFHVIEQELAPAGHATLSSEERAIGMEDAPLAREVFYNTVERAIVPGLMRFGLAADVSWRERRSLV